MGHPPTQHHRPSSSIFISLSICGQGITMHPDPRAQEGAGTPAAPSPSQAGLATPDAEAGSPLTKPAGLTRPVHSCPLPSGLPSPAPSGMFPKFHTHIRPAIWRVAGQGGETSAMQGPPAEGADTHRPSHSARPCPLRAGRARALGAWR